MVDPEILEPEAREAETTSTTGGVEQLVAAVQRVLTGRAVRVEIERVDPAKPRSPLAGGPRFRIEAEGEGGPIVVESGPLFTVSVSFRSARFSFDAGPVGPGPARVRDDVVDKVRALAAEEIVVLEEQRTPRLLRSVVLRADGDRLVEVLDSGLVPSGGVVHGPRVSSFHGRFSGAPTREQLRHVDKLTGGVLGKLRRRVAERVLTGLTDRLARTFEQAGEAASAVTPDDGRRKLGG